MRLRYHPEAIEEGLLAREWYERQGADLGKRFASTLKEALQRIRESLRRYSEITPGVRRALLGKFPFQIVFREHPDDVEILAIAHLKRSPGYWTRRLREQPPGPTSPVPES